MGRKVETSQETQPETVSRQVQDRTDTPQNGASFKAQSDLFIKKKKPPKNCMRKNTNRLQFLAEGWSPKPDIKCTQVFMKMFPASERITDLGPFQVSAARPL